MRIKLLRDLPLEPRHGLCAGREFDVVPKPADWKINEKIVAVMGDAGEVCGVYVAGRGREAIVISHDEED